MERRVPNVLVDYAWYQDGIGMIGLVPKVKLPPLKRVVEEYIAGGMAGPVKIDMATLETEDLEVTIAEPNPSTIKMFGLMNGKEAPFTFRAAFKGNQAAADRFKCQVYGRVYDLDFGDMERKKLTETTCKITWSKLKLTYNGEVLADIDLLTGKENIGGVDRRSDINSALGL
ncbi:phage major tail tube protein [Vibrio sp. ER1A]|uniref:phage major tail tube protein n=1 Tax=Vibrio sp. ER1A TaxID=1517681 RepID=UPI0004DD7837|nr:phage major tail tube protein [Vibrio sp. ER1A]KFA98773.1 tail protein [Vibrio sp. ER1A]